MSKRKAPDDNPNNDLCDFLTELANYERNINRNVYKYNAYRKAASVLGSLPNRVESGEEARKLNGIGDKIAKKIEEFLQTGKLQKLEKIHNEESTTAVNLLTRISGIGPVKAKKLVDDGIKSIKDLENNKSLLNHHQLIGLRYFNDFEQKISRSEITDIENLIKCTVYSKLDSKYVITICGSYRRGKSFSGDIDILLTHPNYNDSNVSKEIKTKLLKDFVDFLKDNNLITETISIGDSKFMGVCKYKNNPSRRLDIRLTPKSQYYCSILYFTGSDLFNKTMRAHALENGFTLNEYSLRPVGSTGVPGEPVEITSEEDIFDYINFKYKTPEKRNM